MNESTSVAVGARPRSGRLYLWLGILLALAGPVLSFVQIQAKILKPPLYVPVLATVGLALIVVSLVQGHTVWRWIAVTFFTLFAAGLWVLLLVVMRTSAYDGPVQAGQSFPAFTTMLATGEPFTNDNLKGKQNTVLVFFRGRW
jgi:hypothetical protein